MADETFELRQVHEDREGGEWVVKFDDTVTHPREDYKFYYWMVTEVWKGSNLTTGDPDIYIRYQGLTKMTHYLTRNWED